MHRRHYHVQLAAINISRKKTVFYFECANVILHLSINPLGLIVKGLDFSKAEVFSIECIPVLVTRRTEGLDETV